MGFGLGNDGADSFPSMPRAAAAPSLMPPDAPAADPWLIDPVTARVRTAEALEDPMIVVIEPAPSPPQAPSLALALGDICEFLGIGITRVAEPRLVPELLRGMAPIAVLCEVPEGTDPGCAVYDLLMIVAGYDPSLPVMLMLPENQHGGSEIDAVTKLWELTGVVRTPRRPGIRGLIDFLFLAGRTYSRGRFMPVGGQMM